jgi:hypothetical protein
MKIIAACPFNNTNCICIVGNRYRVMPNLERDAMADPLPQDLDGLLWIGKCDCCEKVTGGVR